MALIKNVFNRILFTKINRITIATPKFTSSEAKNIAEDLPIDIENPYKKETRVCILCKLNITPNYKNYRLLSQFQSPYTGKIYRKNITGLCEAKQKLVEMEINKAQHCGYMPYYYKNKEFLKDPKLFDPENPVKGHAF